MIRLQQFNTKLQDEASNPAESSSECVKSSSLGDRKASQVTHQPSVRQTPEFTGHFFVPSHTKSGFWSRKSPPAIGQLPAIWWKSADKLLLPSAHSHLPVFLPLKQQTRFYDSSGYSGRFKHRNFAQALSGGPNISKQNSYGLKLIISSAADSLSLIYSTGSLQSSGE